MSDPRTLALCRATILSVCLTVVAEKHNGNFTIQDCQCSPLSLHGPKKPRFNHHRRGYTHRSPGSIECACTTKECRESGQDTCVAATFCYVQYYPTGGDNPDIVRGCIDNRTPILCENRRPNKLTPDKHWPILHCCKKKDRCNHDVLPNIPPDAIVDIEKASATTYIKPEDRRRQNATSLRIEVLYDKSEDPIPTHSKTREHVSHRLFTINPIFVAIPTVGVFIFLLLIGAVLYLLKRRNLSYRRNLTLYKSHLVAQGLARHLGNASCGNCDRFVCIHSDSNRGDVRACCHSDAYKSHNRCTDSERSSSTGSETKLFVPT